MERIQNQLNRIFDGYTAWRSTSEFPPINVWISEESVMITAEMPGLSAEDIEVSVVNDTLTIKGSRKAEASSEEESLVRQERVFGQFSRSLQLPFRIESDAVNAKFSKGVLHLTLPRAQSDKPRKISVSGE
jgi:HSP20 family protein